MPIPTASNAATPSPTPAAPPTQASPAPAAAAEFQPVAAVLAVALPGLGHAFLNQPRRAIAAGAGVLGLFFTGLLMGGVDVVDRRENPVWFAGQAIVGPVAWGVDWVHQNRLKVTDRGVVRSPRPNETRDASGAARLLTPAELAAGAKPPYTKSLGKMNELGMLFCAVAGMLNLIVIVDAAVNARRGRRGTP